MSSTLRSLAKHTRSLSRTIVPKSANRSFHSPFSPFAVLSSLSLSVYHLRSSCVPTRSPVISSGGSLKWDFDSEGDALDLDAVKLVWFLLAIYFAAAATASTIGFTGVAKRKLNYVRFSETTPSSTWLPSSTLQAGVCEELARQPDLMRDMAESGLNLENCEYWFGHAAVAILGEMLVFAIVRTHFVIALSNDNPSAIDYDHDDPETETIMVYAPVPLTRLSLEDARELHATEARVSPVPPPSPRSHRHHRHHSHTHAHSGAKHHKRRCASISTVASVPYRDETEILLKEKVGMLTVGGALPGLSPSRTWIVFTTSLQASVYHSHALSRQLTRNASLPSLSDNALDQTSGSGTAYATAARYNAPTAFSRAKAHSSSTSRLQGLDFTVPPNRPSTPSSNPVALRLTMPTTSSEHQYARHGVSIKRTQATCHYEEVWRHGSRGGVKDVTRSGYWIGTGDREGHSTIE
ncbi:hypothetical protein BC835DRAFT_1411759 [Cytidiella melzeri]|nr:hypothetical protein BC835DRAFT_1411759 [Cytidiella melzeri]